MSECVKESICTQCKHRDICKYCDEVIKAESEASKINVMLNINSPASVRVVCARREISYITVNSNCITTGPLGRISLYENNET